MKKAFLIVFAIGTFLMIVAFTAVFFLTKMVFSDLKPINKDSINAVIQIEKDRIKNLPEIKAIVIGENTNSSPFRNRISSLTLINIGYVFERSESKHTKSRYRKYSYSTHFSKYFSGYNKDSVAVLIDGKRYILALDSVFVNQPNFDATIENKKGIIENGFTTDYHLNEALRNKFDFKIENVTLPSDQLYLRKHKKLMDLRFKYPIMKGYNLYWNDRIKYHQTNPTPDWYYGFSLLEYNLKKGDTLSFKGKIENNKIIKLY